MAGSTGLEPAASAVTGQRSNQLNYDPAFGYDGLAETLINTGYNTYSVVSPAAPSSTLMNRFRSSGPRGGRKTVLIRSERTQVASYRTWLIVTDYGATKESRAGVFFAQRILSLRCGPADKPSRQAVTNLCENLSRKTCMIATAEDSRRLNPLTAKSNQIIKSEVCRGLWQEAQGQVLPNARRNEHGRKNAPRRPSEKRNANSRAKETLPVLHLNQSTNS